MGMYDTIGDGEQIKCFYVPYFCPRRGNQKHGSIAYSGGSLNYYPKGSLLPYKTLWYKHPEDFLIIDTTDDDFGYDVPPAIHIVQQGRYQNTTSKIVEIPDEMFKSEVHCIDYHGERIYNIFSKETLQEYLTQKHQMNRARLEILDKYQPITAKFFNDMKENRNNPAIAENLFLNYKENIQKEHDELYVIEEPFTTKYRKETPHDEAVLETFGAHLDIYHNYLTLNTIPKDDIVDVCLSLRDCIDENPTLSLDEFFDWNETPTEQKPFLRTLWVRMIHTANYV